MCTWAGYVGSGNASDIAYRMLKRIEGLWAGYYSGLLTGDSDGIRFAKLKGSLEIWRSKYDPADFPGSSALFHSRTDSGGGDESAHPFIAPGNSVGDVSQGCLGEFAEEARRHVIQEGNRLLKAGVRFPSASPNRKKMVLADGSGVCMSEVIVALVGEEYAKSHDPVSAIRNVCSRIPEESVTGFIFADRPKNLYFANTSQSIVAGKDSTGVYCASSTIAFPRGVSNVAQLPYNSVIEVSPDGWRSEMLAPRFDIMGDMPPESEKCFVSWLSQYPGALLPHAVDGALRPLCPEDGKLYPCAAFGYRMLEKLNAEGRLKTYIPEGDVMAHLELMP